MRGEEKCGTAEQIQSRATGISRPPGRRAKLQNDRKAKKRKNTAEWWSGGSGGALTDGSREADAQVWFWSRAQVLAPRRTEGDSLAGASSTGSVQEERPGGRTDPTPPGRLTRLRSGTCERVPV